jgi:NodT family efflux transporter outer membrane factor (OMF) lipoprotein
MKSSHRMAVLGAAVLMAGCSVGPEYKKPDVAMPAAWQSETPFHQGVPSDAAMKGNWWELFNDAELNRLEQLALKDNQSLLAAVSRFDQARAQVDVTSAGLFPAIGLQAGAARQKSSADRPLSAYATPNQSTVQNNYQLGVSASYEADFFGRVRNTVTNVRASAEEAAADLENTRLLLMAQLATDYFNLRELDAEIDVLRQGIVLQEKALAFIDARHELGVASGLDLAQQQSVLDASRTQLELLVTRRAQFQHALATLSGIPASNFVLAPAIVNMTPPQLPVGIPSDVLQRRPDIASAERAIIAANANIGVAKAAYFPTVQLQTNGGWNSNEMSNLLNAPSLLWSLGASLTQTGFDAGRTTAVVKISEAAYRGTVANYRQSVLTAMQDVEDGIEGVNTLARAQTQADNAVNSAQRVLDLANDRYTGGLDTYLDVITAQQTLLTNQRQSVQIRGQQMTTSIFLVKALGGGWSDNTAAMVAQAAK